MQQNPKDDKHATAPPPHEVENGSRQASEKPADISEETAMDDPSLPNRNIGKDEWDRDDLKKHKKDKSGSAESY